MRHKIMEESSLRSLRIGKVLMVKLNNFPIEWIRSQSCKVIDVFEDNFDNTVVICDIGKLRVVK